MGSLIFPHKAQKSAIGGAGALVAGTVQKFAEASGFALTLTRWAGNEIKVHVTAQTRYRWSATTSTSIDSSTEAADAASPVATGGGVLYPDQPNFLDVPRVENVASGEGVFLVLVPVSGSVDVIVEVSG